MARSDLGLWLIERRFALGRAEPNHAFGMNGAPGCSSGVGIYGAERLWLVGCGFAFGRVEPNHAIKPHEWGTRVVVEESSVPCERDEEIGAQCDLGFVAG